MTCEVQNKEINSECAELLVRPLYIYIYIYQIKMTLRKRDRSGEEWSYRIVKRMCRSTLVLFSDITLTGNS